MQVKKIFLLVVRLTVSIILIQTLFFKFSAHPDSVFIFSELGFEPWGRVGLGIVELIVATLILIPQTSRIGMYSSLGIILGAIVSHLTVIGISVSHDGGGLFSLALIVFISSLTFLLVDDTRISFSRIKIIK